jgi:hypothetical protein
MNEKINIPIESVSPLPMEIVATVLTPEIYTDTLPVASIEDHRDVGAIDVQKLQEDLSRAIDPAAIVVSGVRGWVARKKMERAGNRMEKMEHKLALYGHIGEVATQGSSSILERNGAKRTIGEPHARSFIERHMDKKVNEKDRKQFAAKLYYERDRRNSGTYKSNLVGNVSKSATNARKRDINKSYKAGNMSASQRNLELLQADSSPNSSQFIETNYQRRVRNKLNSSTLQERKIAEQTFMQAHRTKAQARSVSKIQKYHAKAEKFADLKQQAQIRRQDRKLDRAARRAARP